MNYLPHTPGFLPQDNWDPELRLCHELWVRGVSTSRSGLSPARLRAILETQPLDRKELRQADTHERRFCIGLDCHALAQRGSDLCANCYMREYRRKIAGQKREERVAKTPKTPITHWSEVGMKHPWKHARDYDQAQVHSAVLQSEERKMA